MARSKLEEIDPMTGEVIDGTAMAFEASERIEAGGFTWAYRKAAVKADAATPDKLPVLMLHGVGSCSYTYRNALRLLGEAGYDAMAVDWIGHGASSKPTSDFDYSADAYVKALEQFVAAVGIKQPFVLVVQGYILGQYGMLYALENEDSVAKLVILNTPLGLKVPLRPELAAYKNPVPFLRPKPGAKFAADLFNASGGPYAMAYRDAQAYAAPYESDPAASAAIAAIMDKVDFPALLKRVDQGYESWRKPSLLLFGTSDTLVPFKSVFDWLDSKRTCMKLASGLEAKLGHMPQEDYAEAIMPTMLRFLEDQSD